MRRAQQLLADTEMPLAEITGAYGDLSPEDRNSYCFWAGQLYSIGAAFCSRQQTVATCTEVPGGSTGVGQQGK